ncbi:hypothetical protein C8D83_10821 [Halothiobacillus neapolitanus]|nr:hypothetical protein C8D83_10821 [Halothiobacillus neapolitanus]
MQHYPHKMLHLGFERADFNPNPVYTKFGTPPSSGKTISAQDRIDSVPVLVRMVFCARWSAVQAFVEGEGRWLGVEHQLLEAIHAGVEKHVVGLGAGGAGYD